jgi:hypothetical protein
MASVYEGDNDVDFIKDAINQWLWKNKIGEFAKHSIYEGGKIRHSLVDLYYDDEWYQEDCSCYYCSYQRIQSSYIEAYTEPLQPNFKAENDDTYHIKKHGKSIDDSKRHIKQVRKFNAKQMQIKKSFNPTAVKTQSINLTKCSCINRYETD